MISLNGFWDFGFVGELEEYKGAEQVRFTTSLPVPGCFDVEPGFKLRRGVGVYRTRVVIGGPVTLVFDGIGPKAESLWDGQRVGEYVLPFSRAEYRFDAGEEREHTLLVAVDNRADDSHDSLFPGFYDFYRHGGIYRSAAIGRMPPAASSAAVQSPNGNSGAPREYWIRNSGVHMAPRSLGGYRINRYSRCQWTNPVCYFPADVRGEITRERRENSLTRSPLRP